MVELHEGEYCRTKLGFIAKLIEIDDDGLCWFDGPITESGGETYNLLYPDEIDEVRKHYKDITKVIEERRLYKWIKNILYRRRYDIS